MASFTKEVNPRLAKRPLVFNGCLANLGLTSLVKEATDNQELNNSKMQLKLLEKWVTGHQLICPWEMWR